MAKKKKAPQQPASKESAEVQAGGAKSAPKWLPLIIAFAFGFLLYTNTIGHDYAVDDSIVIVDNAFTKQGFAGIGDIMTTDAFEGHFGERGKTLVAGGRYRPLSIATFAMEYSLFGGLNPGISHFVNALLYGLTGIVLLKLLLLLFPLKKGQHPLFNIPFLVTVVYLAHPIHTEAVANIKGRDEVMGFLFSITALWLFVRYVKAEKVWLLAVGVVVYFLALLSKENAITFLAVVPLTYFVFTKAKARQYALTLVPMLVAAAVFLLMRNSFTVALGSGGGTKEILNDPFVFSSTAERFGTVFYTFGVYFKLLFFPHPLTHDYYPYHVPVVSLTDIRSLIPLIISIGLVGYALWKLKSKDVMAYGILFYFITFSIVSNFFFTVGVNMSERFIYMPSLGFALIVGVLIYRLGQKVSGQKVIAKLPAAALGLLAVILLLYAAKTVTRNADWHDNFSLFSADVKVSENSAKLNMAYGGELITQAGTDQYAAQKDQMLTEAIQHLNRAIELYPDTVIIQSGKERPIGYANAYNLLGNAYYGLNKDLENAEYAYQMAAYYRPGHFDAFQNLVVIYNDLGQHQKSLPYLRALINHQPNNADFYFKMGDAYKNMGVGDTAALYYQNAWQINPELEAAGTYNIGLAYGRYGGNLQAAIPYLQKAVEMNPNSVEYLEDLGVAYGMLGQHANAIPIFEKVIELRPEYGNAYNNLAASYNQLGNTEMAEYYIQEYQKLNSGGQ